MNYNVYSNILLGCIIIEVYFKDPYIVKEEEELF